MKTKKRYTLIVLIALILPYFQAQAQVGINTTKPQGIFHVDAQANTNGNINVSDDVIVTNDGRVGLGTNNPQAKLDIIGSLQYDDGTQNRGQLLTSDALGSASWSPVEKHEVIRGSINLSGTVITNTIPEYKNAYITLPAGDWLITLTGSYMNYTYQGTHLVWRLSTSSSSIIPYISPGRSTVYSCHSEFAKFSAVTAYFFVSHTTEQTYYFWTNAADGPAELHYTGEQSLFAIPLK